MLFKSVLGSRRNRFLAVQQFDTNTRDSTVVTIGLMQRDSFDECAEVLAKTREICAEPLERLVVKASESLAAGGKILFFGNGGSASDAQHLATELSVRFVKTRRS